MKDSHINHNNICPICSEKQLEYFTTCTDNFTTKEKFDILRCKSCELLITGNAPDSQSIGRYYQSENYISHTDTSKGLINKIYHLIRGIMLNKKLRLVKKHSNLESGNLLDYGAGTGSFVKHMIDSGWKTIGLEKSEDARKNCSEWNNITLYDDNSWHMIKDHTLDVITLWHVMEHIENLDYIWQCFREKLKADGKLILALPNPDSYDAKKYNADWAAFDVPRHLWHFNKKSLMTLAKQEGFVLESTSTMPFDGFYISMLSEKNKNNKLPFLKGCFTGTVGFIKSLRNKTNSSSLIYVLRKEEK